MIKFFRSIRKRLLNQNKLGKYLIYAGGEILLVVIGILIALQVNNWQQEKRNSIKEHDVLEQLKAGFESNDRLIKSGIERYQWQLGTQLLYIKNTGPEAIMPAEAELQAMYRIGPATVNLSFGGSHSIVLNEYFDHTDNTELKEAILSYLGRIPQYLEWEDFDKETMATQRELYAKYYSLATNDSKLSEHLNSAYPSRTIDWLKDRETQNIATMRIWAIRNNCIPRLSAIQVENQKILDIINAELKRFE